MFSKIILGTVQFGLNYGINNIGGKISKLDASKILNYSSQNEISFLDTAASYGDSENVIGEYLKENSDHKFRIISKLLLKNQTFEESIQTSLQKLQIKKIDTILFHSYDDYKINKENLSDYKMKYQNKLFDKIGVSLYTNKEVENVIEDENIDVVQVPFNILDNASKREVVYKKIKDSGKTLHTRSVFLQGLIFKKPNELQNEFEILIPYFKKIENLCFEYKISINELALSYVLSKKYIDGVLIGVDNLEQLKRNINIAKLKVSSTIFKEIDEMQIQNESILNPSNWNKK